MYQDEEKSFDIRVLEKHFPVDEVSREKVEHYLGTLPDVTEKIDHEYRFNFTSSRHGYESLSTRESDRKESPISESLSDQHSPDPKKHPE